MKIRSRLFGAALFGAALSGVAVAAVPRPWSTPVASESASGVTVGVWGREYAFASNALPVRILSAGSELLAAPMRLTCALDDGTEVVWTKAGSWIQERGRESVTVCSWQSSPRVTADVVSEIAFDGLAKTSLALMPGPASHRASIARAWLEIPLRREAATLYNYSPCSWSRFENAGGVTGPLAWPWRCAVWLGNERAGLSWFCESDEPFVSEKPERVIEVLPEGEVTVLRIRLVDRAVTLPRTWVFGLEATPVKPRAGRFTANHTVHAPQMGCGITIKRPEVWWTAQRAFPNGHSGEVLDAAAKAGVKTVCFHEDWIPVQNNPTPRSDFKALVDACHARGMKALVYQGYELSPLDPHWGDHAAEWLATDAKGEPVSYWYREPGQRDYRLCYANGSAELWLKRAKKAYLTLGLDGFYLDGTVMPRACANAKHGCGWTDAAGKRHATYPFFAVRRMMRALYEFVDARGGRIDAHQSGYICPATLAFAHSYWDGEQLAVGTQDIRRTLNLAAFRAEFMGVNHGVPAEFLCYERPGAWSYDDALALTLLHNVTVRPCGFVSIPRIAPVWKALDAFGTHDAAWTPYWQKPVKGLPELVEASVWRRADGATLTVVANLDPERAAEAVLPLAAGHAKARDAMTGAALNVADGAVRVRLEPFRHALVECTK